MIEIFAVIAITAVLGHALGMNVTDAIHAVKGTESPRMQKFAARRENGTAGPRRGFGLYWDEAWEAAAARRRKTIDEYGYKPGLRAWLASKWTAGWAKAIDRHGPAAEPRPETEEQATDQGVLGAPNTIDAELETKPGDSVDDAFESIPRSTPPQPEIVEPAQTENVGVAPQPLAEPTATELDPDPTAEAEPVTGLDIEVPVMPQWEGGEPTTEPWSPFVVSPSGPAAADDDETRWTEVSKQAVRDHGLAVSSKGYWVFMLAHTRFNGDFAQAEAEYERQEQELAARKAAYEAANSTGLSGEKYRLFVESYLRFDGDFDRAYRSAFPEAFTQEADVNEDASPEPDADAADLAEIPEADLPPEERFPIFAERAEQQGMPPQAIDAILDALDRGEKHIELRRDELTGGDAEFLPDSYLVHEKGRRVKAVLVPPRERPTDTDTDQILSDLEPINTNIQEESMSNTSGETATLPAAQRYGNAMVEQLTNAITAADQSRASLVSAEVTGDPITALSQAMDQLTAAKTAFANFVAELGRHQAVADAHRAVASAGGKQYLLGD